MSGYLNRLIRRTQAANESQFLRPFVRSASPIAEHDQRLGVAGFEDTEKGISPPTAVDTDPDLGQVGDAQALITPNMTALSDTTVQRKIAGSDTPTTSMSSNPSSASGLGSSDIPSAKIRTEHKSPLGFSDGEQPDLFTASVRESRASVQGDRSEGSTASLSPPMTGKSGNQPHSSNRARQRYADEQQSQLRPTLRASQVPDIAIETNRMAETAIGSVAPPLDMPYPNQPSVVEGEEREQLNDLHPQSSLKPIQSTIPSLEPSSHSLADWDELWGDGGTVSNMDRHDSPQVVIGRITVEVIPQTAIDTTATTSRAGPLTAASVSVIGPLGSGVRSNLRLGLRHR